MSGSISRDFLSLAQRLAAFSDVTNEAELADERNRITTLFNELISASLEDEVSSQIEALGNEWRNISAESSAKEICTRMSQELRALAPQTQNMPLLPVSEGYADVLEEYVDYVYDMAQKNLRKSRPFFIETVLRSMNEIMQGAYGERLKEALTSMDPALLLQESFLRATTFIELLRKDLNIFPKELLERVLLDEIKDEDKEAIARLDESALKTELTREEFASLLDGFVKPLILGQELEAIPGALGPTSLEKVVEKLLLEKNYDKAILLANIHSFPGHELKAWSAIYGCFFPSEEVLPPIESVVNFANSIESIPVRGEVYKGLIRNAIAMDNANYAKQLIAQLQGVDRWDGGFFLGDLVELFAQENDFLAASWLANFILHPEVRDHAIRIWSMYVYKTMTRYKEDEEAFIELCGLNFNDLLSHDHELLEIVTNEQLRGALNQVHLELEAAVRNGDSD